MGGFGDVVGGLFGMFGDFAQADNQRAAGEVQAAGYNLQAQGDLEGIHFNEVAQGFDINVQNLNEQRKLSTMATMYERTLGQQMSAVAANNLDLTSKSALMVHNETADLFENSVAAVQMNYYNQTQSKMYQTAIQNNNLRNQAAGAQYQAQAATAMADAAASQSTMAGIGSLIGGFGGLF